VAATMTTSSRKGKGQQHAAKTSFDVVRVFVPLSVFPSLRKILGMHTARSERGVVSQPRHSAMRQALNTQTRLTQHKERKRLGWERPLA
jgi:hypothetical protein